MMALMFSAANSVYAETGEEDDAPCTAIDDSTGANEVSGSNTQESDDGTSSEGTGQ